MKWKKAVSCLLAVVMVLGVLPFGALAAGAEWKDQTVSGGTFTDTTADPDKSYEYTITGSDGSVQTVTVSAANSPTGNGITQQTGTGGVYYEKVADPANASGEGYLLVAGNKAVTHAPGLKDVTVEGDRINGEQTDAEWSITKPAEGKLNFGCGDQALTMEQTQKGEGKRKDPYTYSYKVVLGPKDGNNQQIHVTGETIKLSRTYYEPARSWQTPEDYPVDIYLTVSRNQMGTTKSAQDATAFTLYSKHTEPAGTTYTVNTAGLDALLAQSFAETQYTADSWQTYENAKISAENAKAAVRNPYTDRADAEAVLAQVNEATRALDAAIQGLKLKPVEPGTCVKPEITWHRTWESGHSEAPVQNVQHLVDKEPWLDIAWDWNQVKGLTASDSNPWNAKNGTAATWQKGYTGNWTDSSVRRFTGTFTWPAGVGLDGEMTIQSVNDADYQFIYDHINADPDLKARYGNAKVLPINDDMYVFISRASDGEPSAWTQDQAEQHLMFWTGTTGKGIWAQHGNTNADWGRTEPARFLGVNATPAYHGSWPNLVDTGKGSNANVQNWGLNGQANPMAHTDSWYTLTDTNAMKSTLNNLYGAAADLSGQEMRIDIYAFDNSDQGGMDELELILCAAEKSTAQVQVNYWLDSVGAVSLGSSVMTRNIGDIVNLPNGTNTNELNHKKAEAIRIAGADADVSSGNQVEKDFQVKASNNVINVVYTRKIQGVQYYTYDFGVENRYIYKDKNSSAIQSVSVECATDTIGASFSGHDITLSYTPKDALGSFVQATLVVERRNSTNRYPIGIIPASNVLYEENFITGAWTKDDHHPYVVKDNENTVYGYTAGIGTEVSYDTCTGMNGGYTAVLTQDTMKTPSDLSFSFRGLGLDLIGSCGPDYGNVVVKIMQGNKVVKAFVVNTKFVSEIHQVPLLHTQKGLLRGARYDVQIRGVYASPAPAVAAFSTRAADPRMTPEIYSTLRDMGLSDADMSKVEFVNAADNLPAGGAALMAVSPKAETGTQKVAVDGFRVYRTTKDSAPAFAEKEQNLIYTNVMNEAIAGQFYAYIEPNNLEGDKNTFTTATYEGMGGPENELYLEAGTAISFRLNTEGVTAPYAQVSLRAVDGAAQANHTITLAHNTEMYYEIAVENGLVTISNTGDTLLAIGNLKTNCPVTAFDNETKQLAVRAVTAMFAAPSEPEAEFEPETFRTELKVKRLGKLRFATVTVHTSTDVDKLTINGRTVKPSNGRRVRRGRDTEYVFTSKKMFTGGREVSFEVIPYNADGLAGVPVTVKD